MTTNMTELSRQQEDALEAREQLKQDILAKYLSPIENKISDMIHEIETCRKFAGNLQTYQHKLDVLKELEKFIEDLY